MKNTSINNEKLRQVINNEIDYLLEYRSASFSSTDADMTRDEAEEVLAHLIDLNLSGIDGSDLRQYLQQVREKK
jgi:FixJ family two-component response regulator